jgi:hypothetical protein
MNPGVDFGDQNNDIGRFPAKAGPALDAGWIPVRVMKASQNKK